MFVDFGGKSQGIASLVQFEVPPTVGEEMDFHVERYDEREGVLILNRKGATATNVTWDNLEIGQIVEGNVTGMNKGGLELEIKSMRAFMPAGQVDLYFQKDISTFIGQRLKVEVTQFDQPGARSDREPAKHPGAREGRSPPETAGRAVRGTNAPGHGAEHHGIRSVCRFGRSRRPAHVSEMSYRRGKKPADFVKLGDLVEVKIIKFDKESGKLSLSLKAAMADPWVGGNEICHRHRDHRPRRPRGTVRGIHRTGRRPRRAASSQRNELAADSQSLGCGEGGNTIKLIVISIDPAQRRMSLSLKQAGPDPWSTVGERYATDMIVPGKVTRVVEFGALSSLSRDWKAWHTYPSWPTTACAALPTW